MTLFKNLQNILEIKLYSRPIWILIGQFRDILQKRDRLKIYAVTTIQIGLSFLDLVSVALIGLLTALTINGIQSKKPAGTISMVITELGINNFSFQQQAAILGISAGALLVMRTVLTLWFSRKLLLFLNLKGAEFSSRLIAGLLKQPHLTIQGNSVQETIFLVTVGVGAITNGVIAVGVSLVADSALLLVMLVGLTFVNPIISLSTTLAFGLVGFALFQILKKRASSLALSDASWTVKSNQKLEEVLISYREATVRDRKEYYSNLISEYRFKMARAQAEAMFIPTISKYVVEMALVLGSLILAAVQFLLFDAIHAISILSIFLAAGSRIAPAVLRLQQGALQIRSNISVARTTLELWERVKDNGDAEYQIQAASDSAFAEEFSPDVILEEVCFTYPKSEKATLKNINLTVRPGEMIAIVGSSGAGKTTLADVILGVISPTSGQVKLSGFNPQIAIKRFKGSISYVPQDVLIVDGSIRENVGLGFSQDEINDEDVWSALKSAQLEEFVKNLPLGIRHQIGERGANLSGGQRQRLGLARGLYTKPKLLVLDEATSALDGATEANVTETLRNLRGKITLFVIAHRLTTIRDSERIIYLEKGKIRAEGNFTQIQNLVPDFAPEMFGSSTSETEAEAGS